MEDLSFLGISEACNRILDGTYTLLDNIDEYTKDLLQVLVKSHQLINTPKPFITTKTFCNSWQRIKERTLSRILGIHFGYLKSCIDCEPLVEFEATILDIPFITGYSPKEWKKIVNNIIEKKGKENFTKDLRTINLIEANFNFNNSVIARATLECAEQNGLILPEQYSTRKNHHTII